MDKFVDNTLQSMLAKCGITKTYFWLLLQVFLAALLSKGIVVFRGYAIDDYGFMLPEVPINFGLYFSQGRYIVALIIWFFESIRVNVSDLYFLFGIVALFLQAILVVSILRFVGLDNSRRSGLVGAIIVAHPYLTEIFTFRVALPAYCVALLFSIITLEFITNNPSSWRSRVFALLSALAMLLTYQVFVNYFAVAIVIAFVHGQISAVKSGQVFSTHNSYRARAYSLAITSFVSCAIFGLILYVAKFFGLTAGFGVSNILSLVDLPNRLNQLYESLISIYWLPEPVLAKPLKVLLLFLLAWSFLRVSFFFISKKNRKISVVNYIIFVVCMVLLAPISLGVIIGFQVWWPVPRVIAHIAIVTGLVVLLADSCSRVSSGRLVNSVVVVPLCVLLIGFMSSSNQILVDQQRINQWDAMMANRMISRLENHADFDKVKYVYISKGYWPWPFSAGLRTAQGDMNVSALLIDYGKVPLLSEISGYGFKSAKGPSALKGESYCMSRQAWPHVESVTVEGDLAIICLG